MVEVSTARIAFTRRPAGVLRCGYPNVLRSDAGVVVPGDTGELAEGLRELLDLSL
jgi:hypothetical protein